MFKFLAICLFAIVACVAAKPHIIAPVSYATPAVAVAAPAYTAPYYASYAAPYYAGYTAGYAAYPYATYPYAAGAYFLRR